MSGAKKTAEQIVIETDPMREGWGHDLEERIAAALLAAEKRGAERMRERAALTVEEPADWLPTTYQERMARRIRALPVSAPEDATRGT